MQAHEITADDTLAADPLEEIRYHAGIVAEHPDDLVRRKFAINSIRVVLVDNPQLATSATIESVFVEEGAQSSKAESIATQIVNSLQKPSFVDLLERKIDYESILLGERWLCRGGAALLVAPSGVGKSTLIQQMVAEWSCGRMSFGVMPTQPLRVLVIQAENDDDDLHEIAMGVNTGLCLTEKESGHIHENTRFMRVFDCGDTFLAKLEMEMRDFFPDLVVIDPLNAYIGGDAKDPALIASFCRNGLNPLLFKYNCSLILIHHTPKTNYRDTSQYSVLDFSYAGAGGADLTNWARAVLTIEPISIEDGIFRLIAAKRGKRIGWTDDEGYCKFDKHIRHSRERGVIRWEDCTDEDLEAVKKVDAAGRPQPTLEDFVKHIEEKGIIGKTDLAHRVKDEFGNGINSISNMIKAYIERGQIHEHRVKRSNKRDAIMVSMTPQKEEKKA